MTAWEGWSVSGELKLKHVCRLLLIITETKPVHTVAALQQQGSEPAGAAWLMEEYAFKSTKTHTQTCSDDSSDWAGMALWLGIKKDESAVGSNTQRR